LHRSVPDDLLSASTAAGRPADNRIGPRRHMMAAMMPMIPTGTGPSFLNSTKRLSTIVTAIITVPAATRR